MEAAPPWACCLKAHDGNAVERFESGQFEAACRPSQVLSPKSAGHTHQTADRSAVLPPCSPPAADCRGNASGVRRWKRCSRPSSGIHA